MNILLKFYINLNMNINNDPFDILWNKSNKSDNFTVTHIPIETFLFDKEYIESDNKFICRKCGKMYKLKQSILKHIDKC